MIGWEYATALFSQVGDDARENMVRFRDELNRMGVSGWELVSTYVSHSDRDPNVRLWHCIFKRPE